MDEIQKNANGGDYGAAHAAARSAAAVFPSPSTKTIPGGSPQRAGSRVGRPPRRPDDRGASPANHYQTGGNASLRRRIIEKLGTSWQPLLGVLTQNKESPLHKAAAWVAPRMAQVLLPLAERAEANMQPREFRGWDRVRPREILVRPKFQDVKEVENLELEVVQGEVPRGLQGHIFWQSFAQEVLHELRFMSRPILMRLDVEEKAGQPVKLKITNRKIFTPSQIFKKAAEATRDRFAFLRALLWISPTGGYLGDYGTGIVAVDDGLLLTANTTSPVLVDKKTLKFVSHFGRKEDYYPAMPFAGPFPPRYMSAHAFYDENTKEFFSVNYGYGFTRLVCWSPGQQSFQSYLLTDENDRPLHMRQSAHQLMVCRDYVIVFNNDGHLLDFPNPFAQDCMVFLVPRAKLNGKGGRVPCKKLELPMTASHEIADYDCPDGIITFYTAGTVAFAPDMSGVLANDVAKQSGKYYSDMYWGTFPISQSDMGHLGRYKIDAKAGKLIEYRRAQDPALTWDAQYAHTKWGMGIRAHKDQPGKFDRFYATFFGFHKDSVMTRMNDIFETTKYTVYKWEDLPEEPVPAAIVATDCQSWDIVDHFSFEPYEQPGHCCAIPSSDGRRYFICPVQSADSDRFYIFDPDNLAQGPLCILKSPVQLPYVQHPTWVDSLETKRVNYPVDMERDLLVEGIVPSAAKLIREHVLPYFKNARSA